jgi:hypothetical protein
MGLLIVVGILWAAGTAIVNALKSPDGWVLVAIVAGVVVLVIMLKAAAKKRKLEYLTSKYGNPTIADYVYHHRVWQGQTAEQLRDSLGEPAARDDKLLKTIKREVWKYNRTGVNRYRLRITLDNDIVTTWDHKN